MQTAGDERTCEKQAGENSDVVVSANGADFQLILLGPAVQFIVFQKVMRDLSIVNLKAKRPWLVCVCSGTWTVSSPGHATLTVPGVFQSLSPGLFRASVSGFRVVAGALEGI